MANNVGGVLFVRYTLSKQALNTSTLTTEISGFFDLQYFRLFTFRYLLVLPSTPWLGDYLKIEEYTFSSGNNSFTTDLPLKHAAGDVISRSFMIRDIWLEFAEADLTASGNEFYLRWTGSNSTNDYTVLF